MNNNVIHVRMLGSETKKQASNVVSLIDTLKTNNGSAFKEQSNNMQLSEQKILAVREVANRFGYK